MAATMAGATDSPGASPPALAAGGFDGPRACKPAELASAVDLLNHVFRGPPGSAPGPARPPDLGWAYSFVYHPGNLDNLRVVCLRGRVVSLAAIHDTEVRTAAGAVRVGGVCGVGTHPDFRGLGLASATLRDAERRMRATGRHLGLLGATIHDFYRALGWERAGRMRAFALDGGSAERLPLRVELGVEPGWRAHVRALCRLHNARLPAARRTPRLMETLLERRAPRVLVGMRHGAPVAYVAGTEDRLLEHAGAAGDVATLVRHLVLAPCDPCDRGPDGAPSGRPRDARDVTLLAPATRAETAAGLSSLLLNLGIPVSVWYIGMARLLDPSGLLAALGLDARLDVRRVPAPAGGGARWRLRRRGERTGVVLDEPELTKLFLGPERRPELSPELFPLDFFQWPVDRV
jgi:ribosomal protein S18 acetylase RimI-like enzyme